MAHYYKIRNLYSDARILNFKRLFSLEKAHGTSCRAGFKEGKVWYFSGGEKHEKFVALFDEEDLLRRFRALGHGDDVPVTLYGEGIGDKQQGMSTVYGPNLTFLIFEVRIGGTWLSVPNAEDVAKKMGLEFVPYKEIEATLLAIDAERDAESIIAIRRGMGSGKMREGIVLRGLDEMMFSNGDRVIAKHKRDEFRESRTKQPRPGDQAKQTRMKAVQDYVSEYAVHERLLHALDAIGLAPEMENTGAIIKAMTKDILEEEPPPEGMDPKAIRKGIGKVTVTLLKALLRSKLEARDG